jgi:septum formation protein
MIRLASQSPRRAELLSQIGIAFEGTPADIDETPLQGELAEDYVMRMAQEKARAVHQHYPKDWVLGSDTSVILADKILGKPNNREDGIAMLSALSGKTHRVLTSVSLVGSCEYHALSESQVTFRHLDQTEIEAYWETGEPADKAGAYAVQGQAAVFISRINGSFSGIMGLPLFETAQLLTQAGIKIG